MTSCPGHWLGRHKYEARYDEVPSGVRFEAESMTRQAMKDLTTHKRYVRDVCVHCGDAIERRSK